MLCEKATQWRRGNFVWKQIAQENTRIQGTRNKMWISVEISLWKQFPCSHCDETLQHENWNRAGVLLTQNDTSKDFYVREKQTLPDLFQGTIYGVSSHFVTYWVIYQWKKRLKRRELWKQEYWIFEKSPYLDVTIRNSSCQINSEKTKSKRISLWVRVLSLDSLNFSSVQWIALKSRIYRADFIQ